MHRPALGVPGLMAVASMPPSASLQPAPAIKPSRFEEPQRAAVRCGRHPSPALALLPLGRGVPPRCLPALRRARYILEPAATCPYLTAGCWLLLSNLLSIATEEGVAKIGDVVRLGCWMLGVGWAGLGWAHLAGWLAACLAV